jgi:hypothetical protein
MRSPGVAKMQCEVDRCFGRFKDVALGTPKDVALRTPKGVTLGTPKDVTPGTLKGVAPGTKASLFRTPTAFNHPAQGCTAKAGLPWVPT